MIDPLFLLFVAFSVGVVAAGWVVAGKLFERRPTELIEVHVTEPGPTDAVGFEAVKASGQTLDVPAPITRMARVDVAEMHAEIEQFLREQSR